MPSIEIGMRARKPAPENWREPGARKIAEYVESTGTSVGRVRRASTWGSGPAETDEH